MTVKLAFVPATTFCPTGWAVMTGGEITVRVAAALAITPAALLTTSE